MLLATASPFNTNDTDVTNNIDAPLWTGDVPGHGYMELYGDAHDILEQIFALNPALRENELYQAGYNPYMDAQPRAFNESDYNVVDGGYFYKHKEGVAHAVAEIVSRGAGFVHEMSADDGYEEAHFYCGTFATGKFCVYCLSVSRTSLGFIGSLTVFFP